MGGEQFFLSGPEELGKIPFHNNFFFAPPKKVLVVFFWGGRVHVQKKCIYNIYIYKYIIYTSSMDVQIVSECILFDKGLFKADDISEDVGRQLM